MHTGPPSGSSGTCAANSLSMKASVKLFPSKSFKPGGPLSPAARLCGQHPSSRVPLKRLRLKSRKSKHKSAAKAACACGEQGSSLQL